MLRSQTGVSGCGGALVADQDLAQRPGRLALLAPDPGLERVDRGRQRGPAHVLHGHPDVGLLVGGLLPDLDVFAHGRAGRAATGRHSSSGPSLSSLTSP